MPELIKANDKKEKTLKEKVWGSDRRENGDRPEASYRERDDDTV